MTTARHDPIEPRLVPDVQLLARACNYMLGQEAQAGGLQRYVRQHYEDAFGAIRVAMDILREIYPRERDAMSDTARNRISRALACLQGAYECLDDVSVDMLGPVMHGVLTGVLTTHEQLDALGVPR